MSEQNLLTDQQIEQIAERAAEKAIQKATNYIYQNIGKSVLSKITYLIGAFIVGASIWLHMKGYLK